MDLRVRRDLGQHDGALAPVADGLDPQAGPALEVGLEVLVVGRVAVALHEAEPARPLVREGADLEPGRVRERSPQLLAAAVDDEEPVRIVHLRAEVVDPAALAGREHVHARAGREPDRGQLDAREEHRLDLHDRVLPGIDDEAVSAGDARAVEQRVHRHGRAARRRLLDPEGAEGGELLAARLPHLHRQAARGQAILLVTADRTEVARALEHRDLVEVPPGVHRMEEPEAREADVLRRQRRRDELADGEQVRPVGETLRLPVLHDRDLDAPW